MLVEIRRVGVLGDLTQRHLLGSAGDEEWDAGLLNRSRRERRRQTPGSFHRPATETVLAYVTALLTCAGLLWLYGQIDVGSNWFVAFTQVIVLGLPTAIGAAAGRLAV